MTRNRGVLLCDLMARMRECPLVLGALFRDVLTSDTVDMDPGKVVGTAVVILVRGDVSAERWDAIVQILRLKWPLKTYQMRVYEKRDGRGWVAI